MYLNGRVAATIVLESAPSVRCRVSRYSAAPPSPKEKLQERPAVPTCGDFPYAVVADLTLWTMRPTSMKFTDNRLGFGKNSCGMNNARNTAPDLGKFSRPTHRSHRGDGHARQPSRGRTAPCRLHRHHASRYAMRPASPSREAALRSARRTRPRRRAENHRNTADRPRPAGRKGTGHRYGIQLCGAYHVGRHDHGTAHRQQRGHRPFRHRLVPDHRRTQTDTRGSSISALGNPTASASLSRRSATPKA